MAHYPGDDIIPPPIEPPPWIVLPRRFRCNQVKPAGTSTGRSTYFGFVILKAHQRLAHILLRSWPPKTARCLEMHTRSLHLCMHAHGSN
jgi:hypothetical protein